MPNLFPYTNTHELNLDWILQVVKDFQTKYTNFDQALADALAAISAGKTEALDEISTDLTAALNDIEASQTAALTAIGNTKDSALADIGTALTNATNAISALNTTVQNEITTLKNTSISQITTAQGTAIAAITASQNHATTIIEQLYNTLPASAQDVLGRLDLLDNIITGNTMESFTWLQGSYVYPEGSTPPTPPAVWTEDPSYNQKITSRYMTGVGGRRIRIITDGTIYMTWILKWTNTPPGGGAGAYVPGQASWFTNTYADILLPLDVTAFSIELAKPNPADTIAPTDIPGHIEIQWITDFVSQRIIAPKESSTTADVARQTGEYFFLDGDLYIATALISVGDTIAEGTNCEKKTVGGELSELKSALHDFGATSTDWADSGAVAQTGKEIYAVDPNAGNNGYINTNQTNGAYIVVPVKEGETIKVSGRATSNYPIVNYFNSATIGKSSYVSTPEFVSSGTNYNQNEFVVPTGTGITHATINTSNQSAYPATCIKHMPSDFVSHLYDAGYAKQSDLEILSGDVSDLEYAVEHLISVVPTIITVKTDGTGDYTNLKAAVNAIVDPSEENPYEIHIYEGTYNVLSDYTSEEIDQAYTPSSTYTDDTFVGVKLQNGVSLIGIGNRDRIILNGELSTTDWGKDWRKNIATLNMKGNGRLENVTLIANNLRYCLHDDFSFTPADGVFHRTLKNVKMRIGATTNYNPGITYGAGMASGGMIGLFEDCDFSQSFGIHSNRSAVKSEITMKNCKGWKALFADYGVTDAHIHMYNCDFAIIELADSGQDHVQRLFVSGVGNEDCVAMAPTGWIYNLGCVAKSKKLNLTAGTAVKVQTVIQGLNNDATFRQYTPTDNNELFYGIVIGEDSYFTYIQHSGYIMGNKTNLSNVNVGDYVGVTTDGALTIVASKSDAVGCIVMVDQNTDFVIKLL